MIIDLKMQFLLNILLMRTYNSLIFPQNHQKFLIFPPPFDEMEEYPPMPVIVQPLSQHRGALLELCILKKILEPFVLNSPKNNQQTICRGTKYRDFVCKSLTYRDLRSGKHRNAEHSCVLGEDGGQVARDSQRILLTRNRLQGPDHFRRCI